MGIATKLQFTGFNFIYLAHMDTAVEYVCVIIPLEFECELFPKLVNVKPMLAHLINVDCNHQTQTAYKES